MGRGGEKTVTPPSKSFHAQGHSLTASDLSRADAASTISSSVRPSKSLEAMPTEELRKKALQYGHDASADRATLLQVLVRGRALVTRLLTLASKDLQRHDMLCFSPEIRMFEMSLLGSHFLSHVVETVPVLPSPSSSCIPSLVR